mmetsp:Transcript_35052/g.34731  ORF Transcript_35052/g.34731 Transcript_35052/m.34731 type:complete len:97 (-) Transcript_35052:13-303(-)
MTTKTLTKIHSHKLSYSEFIAAITAREDILNEEVAEFLLEDLTTDTSDFEVSQSDLLKSPIFANKHAEIKSNLATLIGNKAISFEWLKSHILSLYH